MVARACFIICVVVLMTSSRMISQAQTGGADVYLPLISKNAPSNVSYRTGEGTYYDADGSGNCSFDPSPQDLMVAAMNHVDYAGSAVCGAFVEISGPKGTVTVRIVDQCPGCAAGDIDLSVQAFDRIADRIAGRVPIRWRVVSPDLAGPIVYQFKSGSNQWWSAVQVRNHRNPIATFEYRRSNGQWQTVNRVSYNYFVEPSGMGPGPYAFRVTDIHGNVLSDSGIVFIEGGTVNGGAQFPPAP